LQGGQQLHHPHSLPLQARLICTPARHRELHSSSSRSNKKTKHHSTRSSNRSDLVQTKRAPIHALPHLSQAALSSSSTHPLVSPPPPHHAPLSAFTSAQASASRPPLFPATTTTPDTAQGAVSATDTQASPSAAAGQEDSARSAQPTIGSKQGYGPCAQQQQQQQHDHQHVRAGVSMAPEMHALHAHTAQQQADKLQLNRPGPVPLARSSETAESQQRRAVGLEQDTGALQQQQQQQQFGFGPGLGRAAHASSSDTSTLQQHQQLAAQLRHMLVLLRHTRAVMLQAAQERRTEHRVQMFLKVRGLY